MWTIKFKCRKLGWKKDVFASAWSVPILFWICYSWPFHLRFLERFIYLPWTITQFSVMGQRSVYEIILLDWCPLYGFVCALSYDFHRLQNLAVVYLPLRLIEKFIAFRSSTTSLPWPGSPMPRLIMILYACTNIDSKYNAVSYMYWSAQQSPFSHTVIISVNIIFRYFNKSMVILLCASVVAVSCSLSSEKISETYNVLLHFLKKNWNSYWPIKCSNSMTSIETNPFPP